jgi:hypothetical protein
MTTPARPTRKPKGIVCPHCGVRLHTRRVIPLADGRVRRVKWCRQCGHRCSSFEGVPPATGGRGYHG